jgi:primary-amine oxidase
VQPEGPSYEVTGNAVSWQKWRFRVSMHPLDGLVLHTVGYEDQGRLRPILHRAALSEMVVPYGEAALGHRWKNAFDSGELGLGRFPFVNSLELGCDCVGVIHYFDATVAGEDGEGQAIPNAICMHEEDYGILWKHFDMHTFTTEVRRSRRLVVSSIHTVGNYEYGFFWYFYLDGTMQLEVKLTGILQTMAVAPGDEPAHGALIAPQLAAPHHQHLFNFRLDFDVDGPENSVYETEIEGLPPGPDNPYGNATVSSARLLARESEAQRVVDPARGRGWMIVNPGRRNAVGRPVAYRLMPGNTPTMLADEPVGDAVRVRRTAGRGLSQPARGGCGPAGVDRGRPPDREHRRGGLVHVRRQPCRPARGLAGDAGRVRRLHPAALRVLRPQPRARRTAVAQALTSHKH